MGPSIFRRIVAFGILLSVLSSPVAFAQEGYGEEDVEEETSEPAAKVEKAPEAPRNVYALELLSARDYKTVALLRKQLENLLERGATVVKSKSAWGQLVFEVRSTMGHQDIKNGLLQMQLEEAKLKSVSYSDNRFIVEVQ